MGFEPTRHEQASFAAQTAYTPKLTGKARRTAYFAKIPTQKIDPTEDRFHWASQASNKSLGPNQVKLEAFWKVSESRLSPVENRQKMEQKLNVQKNNVPDGLAVWNFNTLFKLIWNWRSKILFYIFLSSCVAIRMRSWSD